METVSTAIDAASGSHAQVAPTVAPPSSNQPPILIDKITMTFESASDDQKKGLLQQVINMQKDLETGWHPGPRGAYAAAARIHAPSSSSGVQQGPWATEHMLVQVKPRNDTGGFTRLEWNPSKFDSDQTDYLFKQLDNALDLAPSVVGGGKITRCDIAVDLPGVQIGDYVFDSSRSRLRNTYYRLFDLQTVYMGTRAKGQMCIYDKKAQTGSKGDAWTRVEMRTRPNCAASNLISIKNPLNKVQVFDVIHAGLKIGEPHVRTLSRLMAAVGVRGPLSDFPLKAAYEMAEVINASRAKFWQPSAFWAAWPLVLAATFPTFGQPADFGFFDPLCTGGAS
jgi:hypothetical protein